MVGPLTRVAQTALKAATKKGTKKKPTQPLFSDKPSDRQVRAGNIGTRGDPDTGTLSRFSPKEGEKVTKGTKSVEAEQGTAANVTQAQRERAKKYTRLKRKEDANQPMTAAEQKFIKDYEQTEIKRERSARIAADTTRSRGKPITTSTGTVRLGMGRRFKKGNQVKNKLGRGTGVALRGGGVVSKR